MIVPRNGIVQISIDVGISGKNGHQREILITGRTERAEAFHVGNCHNALRLTRSGWQAEVRSTACHVPTTYCVLSFSFSAPFAVAPAALCTPFFVPLATPLVVCFTA